MNEGMRGSWLRAAIGVLLLHVGVLAGCAGQADQSADPAEAQQTEGAEQAVGQSPSEPDGQSTAGVGSEETESAIAAEPAVAGADESSKAFSGDIRAQEVPPAAGESASPFSTVTAAPLRVRSMTVQGEDSSPPQPQAAAGADEPLPAEQASVVAGGVSEVAEVPPSGAAPAATIDPSYSRLEVFYATDRGIDQATASSAMDRALIPVAVAASVTLLWILLAVIGWQRKTSVMLATASLLVTLGLGGWWVVESWGRWQQVADSGIRYGNERGQMSYGTCEVTIPQSHELGEVERPSLLRLEVREDVTKHVVLQRTGRSEKDAFFNQLQKTVEAAPRREVFVFVHGYNVTFDGAARRTAQIAHDVQFQGAPVFFSWPSQGGLLKYTVDETNVEWAVPHLREFLVEITRRSGAESVNLIAHSMGNRALTAALRELQLQLGQEAALFNQIILAAPDIDAEIFRRDLAPALVQTGQRVTLYASSNDQALVASKRVHGYARAGDAGAGLVVLPGIETIDVSRLDTSLLGHSYYGSSDPILSDIRQLIEQALPAAQRTSLLPHAYGDLTYWVFAQVRQAAGPRSTTEH